MEKSVVRKLSLMLIPFLAFIYSLNILDRTNIATVSLPMQHDLHLNDAIYGLAYGIFFIGYFIFEVPANLIQQRVGARRWITRIMLSWGIVSTLTMLVHSEYMLYTLRFLLGVAEAGLFPGIMLYLTYWAPVNGVSPQMINLTDFTCERIPMQTLSLLNLEEEPRLVIYAYGQSLRPAERSVQISPLLGALRGISTNYNVTGEVLIRAVVRIRNAPRIGLPGPFYPQAVIESYDILPSD